jgi:serine/threonine protein kinase
MAAEAENPLRATTGRKGRNLGQFIKNTNGRLIQFKKTGKQGDTKIKNEAEILNYLQECPVSRIEGYTNNNGIYSLTTQYAGINLKEYIIQNTSLTNNVILKIIYNIIIAVKCIHDKHIYHLDIKLNNILIDPSTHAITLIDFETAQYSKNGICTIIGNNWQGTYNYTNIELYKKITTSKSNSTQFNGFSADLFGLMISIGQFEFISSDKDSFKLLYYPIRDKMWRSIEYYRSNLDIPKLNIPKLNIGIYLNLQQVLSDLELANKELPARQLAMQQLVYQQLAAQQGMSIYDNKPPNNNTNRGGSKRSQKNKKQKYRKTKKHVYKPRNRL